MLSSLKTVTATPRGLACGTSSSSFIFGLAVGGTRCLSPATVRPFAAGGPRVWGHSRFSPAAFGPAGVSPLRGEVRPQKRFCPLQMCSPRSKPSQPPLGVWRAGRVHPHLFSVWQLGDALSFPCYSLSFRRRRAVCVGTQSILPCSVRTPCWPPVSPALHTPSTRTRTPRALLRGGGASPVLPLGLLHMRPFLWWMRELRLHPTVPATRLIRVSRSCCRHLLMWRDPVFLQSGVRMGAIHRRHMITTDASMTGWGAVLEGRPASGEWKEEFLFWHINCLELRAVFLALKYFLPILGGYHIIVRTDNMAVVSHINRQGGSRSRTLDRLARHLLLWSQDKFLSLRAVHVPGVLNLAADFLSRQKLKVQGFFICHIIVIQGITRSEMQSNQVRSVTVQNNKNTNYISNITQGHTYGKKRRNKNKMCNEIKKCKTIRCAKNNKMCKRQ